MKALLILRTLRYVKPIQVLNRLWRKRPMGDVSRAGISIRGLQLISGFPNYYSSWDGNAEFTFLNEMRKVNSAADWNDKSRLKLWLYNLHYFDYLRQENLNDTAAMDLMRRWCNENPVGKGNGWEPYPISLRVVNWIKFLAVRPSLATQNILASLCVQVRWLQKRLEYHLLGNHLLANAKALVFAGTFFEGPEAARWYRKGYDIYRTQLPEQVLKDGVHFERSAMYHAIMLEDVLDCYNVTREPIFREYGERMMAGLRLLTGPDGRFAKFNDGADGIALSTDVLVKYAKDIGIESAIGNASCFAAESGFLRLAVGEWTLIAKCGAIGPSYQPGHAHADTFTFELWKGREKIITDTGVDRYVIDAERLRQRGTAAHNVVVIDGRDSSEVWSGHRVGRRALASQGELMEASGGWKFSATAKYNGILHKRTFILSETGLRGVDEIAGRGTHDVELRFHTSRSQVPEITCGGGGMQCDVEPAMLASGYGRLETGKCLFKKFENVRLPFSVVWEVK